MEAHGAHGCVSAPHTECIWTQASKSLKISKGHGNLVPGAPALVDCLGQPLTPTDSLLSTRRVLPGPQEKIRQLQRHRHPDSSCVRERTAYIGRGVLWKSAKLNGGSIISSTNTEKITGRYTTSLCMTIPQESGVGGGAGCTKGQTPFP